LSLLALGANEFPTGLCLDLRITVVTEAPTLVFDEARIRQFLPTELTPEAGRVPRCVHGFDYTPNDELPALRTAWCKEHVEIWNEQVNNSPAVP
jgi:hypothetical protein